MLWCSSAIFYLERGYKENKAICRKISRIHIAWKCKSFMIKVKPLVKFEILLQAHGLHSTGQQADHCLDLVHNNLYLVHAKLPKIAKICSIHICVGIIWAITCTWCMQNFQKLPRFAPYTSVLEFYEQNTGPAPHVNCQNFCQENISKLTWIVWYITFR